MKNILIEITTSSIVSFIIYPFVWIFSVWSGFYFDNDIYVQWVLGAIIVDYLVGVVYHFLKGDFNWGKNILGISFKIFLVLVVGFLFEGIGYFLTEASIGGITVGILRLIVFLFPSISALQNVGVLTGYEFPSKEFIEKLKYFSKNIQFPEKNNN